MQDWNSGKCRTALAAMAWSWKMQDWKMEYCMESDGKWKWKLRFHTCDVS